MSVVVNILATIGLIVIIGYLLYYMYKYISNMQTKKFISQINPPGDYMQNSGIKCPDYWVNTGIDDKGNYICKNSFNIESDNPGTGTYAGKCNRTDMSFPAIKSGYTWEYNNPNGLTSYSDKEKYEFLNTKSLENSVSRCQWINNCGPSSNVQGIWSGVNEICNSPPTK